MPYQRVLEEMVSAIDGAIGAIFVDYEGETVGTAGRDLSLYDMKVIGAYHAIFLAQIAKICTSLSFGEPERFKIECGKVRMLVAPLRDGYYLVLVLQKVSNEGVAWREMMHSRERLLQDM